MIPRKELENNPAMYNNFGQKCTCECHYNDGIYHFIACCGGFSPLHNIDFPKDREDE